MWGRSCVLGLLALAVSGAAWPAAQPTPASVAVAEDTFLDALDASSAIAAIDSGLWHTFDDRDRTQWQAAFERRRAELNAALEGLPAAELRSEDARALGAIRRSLGQLDTTVTPEQARYHCAEARRRDLDYAGLRAALVACFTEIGNRLPFEGGEIDRGSARQALHEIAATTRRKALFAAFAPLWSAVNDGDAPDSPYRRLITLAAAAAGPDSEVEAAARAVGVDLATVEQWLTEILAAWERTQGPGSVEPWDYSYAASQANRTLARRVPADALERLNRRFFLDLGADPVELGVRFDLESRPGKSPLAYTDFVRRGRVVDGQWRAPLARVVGYYPDGGLFSLNELVHETGHAVHISAIRNRGAYMDWPDTLFCEAFADVPSWSVYEPAWQRRYLGTSVTAPISLRALFGDVMLDVAWSLFEIRMLRAPQADPNAVWTEITSRYLHIKPHPELSWWLMRVQLVEAPGYMVNYGLGAVLTAEMRERLSDSIGPFDAGNARWYPWLGEHLLRFGSERDTRELVSELLGRPVSPQALLRQLARVAGPR